MSTHTSLSLCNPDIEPVDPVFAAWRRLSPKTGPASEAIVANYQQLVQTLEADDFRSEYVKVKKLSS